MCSITIVPVVLNRLPQLEFFSFAGGYVVFTIRCDTFENDEFGYAAKFQKFVDDGKWVEVEKYHSDYVLGYCDVMKSCFIVSYKVLKNE